MNSVHRVVKGRKTRMKTLKTYQILLMVNFDKVGQPCM